jgi:hypothetical protein
MNKNQYLFEVVPNPLIIKELLARSYQILYIKNLFKILGAYWGHLYD